MTELLHLIRRRSGPALLRRRRRRGTARRVAPRGVRRVPGELHAAAAGDGVHRRGAGAGRARRLRADRLGAARAGARARRAAAGCRGSCCPRRAWPSPRASSLLVGAAFMAGRLLPRATAAVAGRRRADGRAGARADPPRRSRRAPRSIAADARRAGERRDDCRQRRRVDMSLEQSRAEQLVAANRLYRQTAASTGDAAIASVLDDLERVLVDIAASPNNDDAGGARRGAAPHRIEGAPVQGARDGLAGARAPADRPLPCRHSPSTAWLVRQRVPCQTR